MVEKDILYCNTSRTLEIILGIIGGVFGLIGAVFALMVGTLDVAFSASGTSPLTMLGINAVLASILSIITTAFINKNPTKAGIIIIISALWLLISISYFGILGFVLLGLAGLLAIFKK